MIELLIVTIAVTVNISIISALIYVLRRQTVVTKNTDISNKEVLDAIDKLTAKIQKNLLSGALR